MKTYQLTSNHILYEDGQILSTVQNKHNKTKRPRYLKPDITHNGYQRVSIRYSSKSYKYLLHRLLAMAFIPKPLGKDHINHIDGNKLNNSLDNIEWCTNSENTQHAYATGLQVGPRKQVRCIETGQTFDSCVIAGKHMNTHSGNIDRAARTSKSIRSGLHFKYVA